MKTSDLIFFIYPILLSLYYFFIWRIPINLTDKSKKVSLTIGVSAIIINCIIFSYVIPQIFQFSIHYLVDEFIFLLSERELFTLHGFFAGIACIIPIAGWIDKATRDNPEFQKKNNKAMILWLVFYFFIPAYVINYPQLKLNENEITITGIFHPTQRFYYTNYKSFSITSERYLEPDLMPSKYTPTDSFQLKFILTSFAKEKITIYETFESSQSFAEKTAEIIRFLEKKNILYEKHTLERYTKWQNALNLELER